jgi:hypothetical protein
VYRGREFSLWCDQAGELIVVHDHLRAQQVEDLCALLAGTYAR